MEIITLIENEVSQGNSELKAEAGLSLLIKTGKQTILFDTGSSGAFADNAQKLGVDLTAVDFVVISHAHFDHTGGLERFFSLNSTAKVYIKKEVKEAYYFKLLFLKKYIGSKQSTFKNYSNRFVFVEDNLDIGDNIRLVSRFSSNHSAPSDSKRIFVKKDNKLIPDDFAHEQMMLVSEGNYLYCFTGCSHHGILNMIDAAQQYTNGKTMKVIGGFHMYNPVTKGMAEKKEFVVKTGNKLNAIDNVDLIATGHCTGTGAFKLLKGVLGNKLYDLHTGNQMTI